MTEDNDNWDGVISIKRWNVYYDTNDEYDAALEPVYEELRKPSPNHLVIEKCLTDQAKIGNPVAQYALGNWHLKGKYHYKKDIPKAINLLKQAVQKRVPEACLLIADCYENGTGVEVNHREAFEYYLLSALFGEDEACAHVSRCYQFGIGIEKDNRVAEIWKERAEALTI